jgi:hypothetical protein
MFASQTKTDAGLFQKDVQITLNLFHTRAQINNTKLLLHMQFYTS